MANEHANIRIQELSRKLLEGTISPEEEVELAQWLNHEDGAVLDIPAGVADSRSSHEKRIWKAISREVKPDTVGRRLWIASAAAAVLILMVSGYLLFSPSTPVKKNVEYLVQDYMPATNKAILTLGDGRHVELDSMATGARVGLVVKEDSGRISYKDALSAVAQINSLATPRGGRFNITLHDGTRVWLNAASKLTYLTAFGSSERTVELTGEAYFEVAQDADRPFRVKVNGLRVNVLGTSFNVMAYPDESSVNTTLVEGRVQVSDGKASRLLQPHQQAVADLKTGRITVMDADISKALAWKNDLFIFNNADFEWILREISRWYDIEFVNLAGKNNELYGGSISRNAKLSDVLKLLSTASSLHFTIEGQKVIILP